MEKPRIIMETIAYPTLQVYFCHAYLHTQHREQLYLIIWSKKSFIPVIQMFSGKIIHFKRFARNIHG